MSLLLESLHPGFIKRTNSAERHKQFGRSLFSNTKTMFLREIVVAVQKRERSIGFCIIDF